MRIHLVVNMSQVVRYREQVEEQKIEKVKLIKIKEIEKWKIEKILKKEKDLENTKEVVAEFERRLSAKVRKQEKLNMAEK